MATVSIPHSWNQSARRWRSSVKVPNVRTGSEARSGPTAATCIFAPTSMARGWTGDIARDGTGLFRPVMSASPCVAKQREGAQVINFLTGITARRHHSQVRNNPWTTFFYGIIRHQKFAGRSPPPSDSTAGPFLWPQAGRRPARVFLTDAQRAVRAPPWKKMPLPPAGLSHRPRPLTIFEVKVAHKPISTWWETAA